MRTQEEVQLVDDLIARGLNDCEISRRTGIPRGTVRDWRRGLQPNFNRRFASSPGTIEIADEQEVAYTYLLGLYLGDGHITRLARTYRLRIALHGIYPGIVGSCIAAMETLLPNKVAISPTPSRAVVVSVYSNALPDLFPQHGPAHKHERKIELADWQLEITHRYPQELIRGLIHSDGSRGLNTVHVRGKTYRYPRYYFCNHSDDIRAIFCQHLDLLGIPWRRMNRFNISVAKRDGVARLDEFVGPKR
jgi:hypothetical protein